MEEKNKRSYTATGTNIEDVKKKNEYSGLTYSQVKQLLAKTVGSHDAEFASEHEFSNEKKKNNTER